MFFTINIDATELEKLVGNMPDALKKLASQAGERLSLMCRAHVVEVANQKLHTRRQLYLDNLRYTKVDDHTWLISITKEAMWIEEGMDKHSMVDDLLKKGAKRAKDGSMYKSIPFRHGPGLGSTNATPSQLSLTSIVKAELKNAQNKLTGKKGIPYGKIEKDGAGKPLLGLLHKLDIKDQPIKTEEGPGQGKGPVGKVRQGPTGIPFLQGIRVYQKEVKDPNTGKNFVRRDIMTFRTVSSKHKDEDRWIHPGLLPVKILDETYEWAKKTWEKDVLPAVLADFKKNT